MAIVRCKEETQPANPGRDAIQSTDTPNDTLNDQLQPVDDTEHTLDAELGPGELPQSEASASSMQSQSENELDFVNLFGAVANLCSATLGAGVLSLPFAVYQSGLICGLILLFSSTWATIASIERLALASDCYGLSTYEQVVEHVLGRKFRQAVEISILLFCVGCAVAYVIAVGDILEKIDSVSSGKNCLAMSLVWAFAMLPLSCLRRIQSLQFASTVGIFGIGTLLVAATVHLFESKASQSIEDYSEDDDLHLERSYSSIQHLLMPAHGSFLSILRSCPIVFFAFSCQVNVCQIYDELPGLRRSSSSSSNGHTSATDKLSTMSRVTWVAMSGCAVLYTCICLVTLFDFGDQVKANILSCYSLATSQEAGLLHLAFLAMTVAIVMAFPLNIFPARVSLIQMFHSTTSAALESLSGSNHNVEQSSATQPLLESGDNEERALHVRDKTTAGTAVERDVEVEMEDFSLCQHMLVTVLLAGLALGLALIVPNISVVFGLLGGTTSSLLGFVIPGLLGVKMDPNDRVALVLVWGGSLVGILTTGVTLYSTIKKV